MNDTPRTDSQLARYYDDAKGVRVEYTPARFARQLERELNQRNRELESCKQRHDELLEALEKLLQWMDRIDAPEAYDEAAEVVDRVRKGGRRGH